MFDSGGQIHRYAAVSVEQVAPVRHPPSEVVFARKFDKLGTRNDVGEEASVPDGQDVVAVDMGDLRTRAVGVLRFGNPNPAPFDVVFSDPSRMTSRKWIPGTIERASHLEGVVTYCRG